MKRPAGEDFSGAPRRFATVSVIAFSLAATLAAADPTTEQIQFFESKIRPLLAGNCYPCHSLNANPRFANLRLDSRAGMLVGGDRGPAIIPGDPSASRLIQAIRHENLKMPPTGKLPDAKIAALVDWVEMGAPWPREQAPVEVESASKADPENAPDSARGERIRAANASECPWASRPTHGDENRWVFDGAATACSQSCALPKGMKTGVFSTERPWS